MPSSVVAVPGMHLLPRVLAIAEDRSVGVGGAGFDLEAAKESRGLGLISMEDRLKLLNGTLSVGMGMSQV